MLPRGPASLQSRPYHQNCTSKFCRRLSAVCLPFVGRKQEAMDRESPKGTTGGATKEVVCRASEGGRGRPLILRRQQIAPQDHEGQGRHPPRTKAPAKPRCGMYAGRLRVGGWRRPRVEAPPTIKLRVGSWSSACNL